MGNSFLLFAYFCLLFNEHKWNRYSTTAFWDDLFYQYSGCFIVRYCNHKNQRWLLLDVVNNIVNHIYTKLDALAVKTGQFHFFFQPKWRWRWFDCGCSTPP